MTDSGEKQIRSDLSFLLFFAACFIYCRLSVSILVIYVWTSSLLFPPVCASPSCSISLCLFKLRSRLLMYLLTTCGSRVLSRCEPAHRSLVRPIPTSNEVWISTIRTPLGSESLSLNIEQIFVCPSVCPSVHPHGITVGVYIRIHFWDALLIKFVKIVGLELVWNYPRLIFLVFMCCIDSYV
jgi:hypothetical protein